MHRPSEDYPDPLSAPELSHLEKQIAELRNQISDLGTEVDSFRAKKGGAIGGAVFLLLLALIAFYDLYNGNANLWLAVGITREWLKFFAVGLAIAALGLFALAVLLERQRNRSGEAQLAALEQELEALLVRKSALESH